MAVQSNNLTTSALVISIQASASPGNALDFQENSEMSTIATSGSEGWKKGSVYFLSHGGPPTMFDPDSKPYRAWREYGRRVGESPPRGLVVVSAHWENTEAAGVLSESDC